MLLQHGAGPFPHSTQVSLPGEFASVLGDRNWVPVLETYVGSLEVDEELMQVRTRHSVGGAV